MRGPRPWQKCTDITTSLEAVVLSEAKDLLHAKQRGSLAHIRSHDPEDAVQAGPIVHFARRRSHPPRTTVSDDDSLRCIGRVVRTIRVAARSGAYRGEISTSTWRGACPRASPIPPGRSPWGYQSRAARPERSPTPPCGSPSRIGAEQRVLADHPSFLADHPSFLDDHLSFLADHRPLLADHRPFLDDH